MIIKAIIIIIMIKNYSNSWLGDTNIRRACTWMHAGKRGNLIIIKNKNSITSRTDRNCTIQQLVYTNSLFEGFRKCNLPVLISPCQHFLELQINFDYVQCHDSVWNIPTKIVWTFWKLTILIWSYGAWRQMCTLRPRQATIWKMV